MERSNVLRCGNPSRRNFFGTLAAGGAMMAMNAHEKAGNGASSGFPANAPRNEAPIKIKRVNSDFTRESLIRPFGFKGGYLTEIWETAFLMESESGNQEIGLNVQGVLWSDALVFESHSEAAGNALMYLMSEYAVQQLKGRTFYNPVRLLEDMLDDVYEYGKSITGNPNLRKTFALNAMVGIDNTAWLLYAHENGFKTFDEMVPEEYRPAVSNRHDKIASIPLMAYSIPIEEIVDAVNDGYFFLKIKIGQPGTQEEMLEKDKQRITAIHKAIGHRETPHTKDGKIPYYFDANGRYESKETLLKLLDHIEKLGARDQIAIIEEPFPEHLELDVSGFGVRLAADESAHTDEDAVKRIQMGYGAIAVKAIAKTLSMTLKIVNAAHQRNVPCFCADLTVSPIVVEWNKNVAARLAPFPGLGLGLLETNGHQNYKRWATLVSYHPYAGAPWTITRDGVFVLDEDYYAKSGGIFAKSQHYVNMFNKK